MPNHQLFFLNTFYICVGILLTFATIRMFIKMYYEKHQPKNKEIYFYLISELHFVECLKENNLRGKIFFFFCYTNCKIFPG